MSEHVLFVGDIAPEVDEPYLMSFFSQYYSTVKSVAVMNKGFGYVRFTSEADRDRAIQEMQGVYIGSRMVRVSAAAPKGGPSGALPIGGGRGRESSGPDDPNNTTLFVGGLNSMVDEHQLRAVFEPYGSLAYARIPPGKGCGFIHFLERGPAERALQELNGSYVGSCAMRITWGKSNKPPPGAGGYHHSSGGGSSYPPASHPPAYPGYPPYSSQYSGAGGAYGGYDAYSAYSGYSADPSYAYGSYGASTYPSGGMAGAGAPQPPSASAATSTLTVGSGATGAGSGAADGLYDPLVPVSVDRLNAAYIKRLSPVLAGSFMRVGA